MTEEGDRLEPTDGTRPGRTDETRLGPRDRIFLAICLLVTLGSLALGIHLYPRANPEASIRFEVSREDAREIAERFAGELGISLDGTRHASRFDYDDRSKVFLERTLGFEETNRQVTGPVRMWRWAHRWFRPLEKEELRVDVATSGEIVGFEHVIAEDAPGGRPSVEEARALAEAFVRKTARVPLEQLEFLDGITTERKGRTDHTFVWKDPRVDLGHGDYRHEVQVVGGEIGGYRQFVHLPEAWQRDYQGLRSRNQSTSLVAFVLIVLSILAAVVIFLRRIRLRDVRWKLALGFGATGAALVFCGQLNLYPMFLFEFDTTTSWGGFLLTGILQLVESAVAVGLLIFLLTAAGDALYRERYPDKVSLGALFTLRGLRTKRFLHQTVLGFALAAGFFLFQELFYLLAFRLGAWAPAEVPYTELLGTAVPFLFLLLVGFQPAVVEEFLSRMFSIPFLQKVTHRTWIAVLVPALIWGFAHANYPNQPFYIRGLEVGFVGVVMGLVMLRTGILAPLVWHYLVDALYSSIFLLRSGQPYYVASAALAAGVVALPLVYAIVCYLRRGRFEDPEPLLSRSQPGPREPEWIPEIDVVPPPPPSWRARRRLGIVGAGALLLILAFFLPSASLDRPDARSLSPEEARVHADEFAEHLLGRADSFHVAVLGESGSSPWLQYVAEEGGWEAARQAAARYGADFRWKIRYFRPLDPNELVVEIDGANGRLLALSRHLGEEEVRPSIGSDVARIRAQSFLVARGVETSRLLLREFSTENRPGRLDHTFVWEAREDDAWNVGEGHHRVEVVVQGDEVGEYRSYLRVPERWQREREKNTLVSGVRLLLLTLMIGLLGGLVAWLVFDGHRRGVTRWSEAARVAIVFGVIVALERINEMPTAWSDYETATPWNQFILVAGALLALSAVVVFGLEVVAGGVIGTLFPDVWHLKRHDHRRARAWDALAAGLAGLALCLLVVRGLDWLGALVPRAFPPKVGAAEISSLQPWFQVFARVTTRWLFCAALLASGVRLAQLGRYQRRVWAIVLLVVLLLPSFSSGLSNWAIGLVPIALGAAVLAIFVRWIAGENRLAHGVALWMGLAALELGPFLGAKGLYFQMQGGIAFAVLLLPVLWLALTATVRESRLSP